LPKIKDANSICQTIGDALSEDCQVFLKWRLIFLNGKHSGVDELSQLETKGNTLVIAVCVHHLYVYESSIGRLFIFIMMQSSEHKFPFPSKKNNQLAWCLLLWYNSYINISE